MTAGAGSIELIFCPLSAVSHQWSVVNRQWLGCAQIADRGQRTAKLPTAHCLLLS
jgi:hypothetical protein